MLEVKAKLLSKWTKTIPAVKAISFEICDPFIAEYWRITELAYGKLKNLSQIFYSGGCSLFARMTACIGANPKLMHQFYEFGYLDLVYLDKSLTKLFYFPQEMKNVLRTFNQKPIFVKLRTIHPEKDEASGTHYPAISLIQVGYLSKYFKLNIETTWKFDPFRFNETWINYRRTSAALALNC